eukprot:TRINITY_DN37871_c0_g1_i1.p1 TRINITY_DN37871_c0_g1~~TRINITY_DN37871_c0_g1_i1.p1  ORF type:complete len:273 (+),score=31.74 TRINITY_DN37871_c0_g1_i1:68-886(+)
MSAEGDFGNQSMLSYQSNEDLALVHHLEIGAFKHLSRWLDGGTRLLQVAAHGFENWRDQCQDPLLKYHLAKVSAICFEFYSHRQRLGTVLEKMQLEHMKRSYSWMQPIRRKTSPSLQPVPQHTIEINNLPGEWSPERLEVLSNACGSPTAVRISTNCKDCAPPHVPSSLEAVYSSKEQAQTSFIAINNNVFGQCVSPPRASVGVNRKVATASPPYRGPVAVTYSELGESLEDRIARLSKQRAEEICREVSRSRSRVREPPPEPAESEFEPLY